MTIIEFLKELEKCMKENGLTGFEEMFYLGEVAYEEITELEVRDNALKELLIK